MITNYLIYSFLLILALDLLFTSLHKYNNNNKNNNTIQNKDKYIIDDDNEIKEDFNHFDFYIINDINDIYENEELNHCFSLINEFNTCFMENSHNINLCYEIIEEKKFEFEKCDSLFFKDFFDKHTYNNLMENDEFEYIDEEILLKLLNEYEEDEEEIKNDYDYDDEVNNKKKIFEEIIIIKNDSDCDENELLNNGDNEFRYF